MTLIWMNVVLFRVENLNEIYMKVGWDEDR